MDLVELHNHAKRRGEWSIALSAKETLHCTHVRFTGDVDMFLYFVNGTPVEEEEDADRLLAKVFEDAINL